MGTTKKVIIHPSKKAIRAPIAQEQITKHATDFFQWTRDQMQFLKDKEFEKLDIENLIGEIESLGNSERNAIESHMIVLFVHLLKMEYQPAMRSNSWENSIENAKFRIQRLIKKNPSLKKEVFEAVPDAYYSAKLQASSETGLDKKTFPKECPWTLEELFSELNKKMKKKYI
jgi:hypothetical protein